VPDVEDNVLGDEAETMQDLHPENLDTAGDEQLAVSEREHLNLILDSDLGVGCRTGNILLVHLAILENSGA
jgi:hypothetical protein